MGHYFVVDFNHEDLDLTSVQLYIEPQLSRCSTSVWLYAAFIPEVTHDGLTVRGPLHPRQRTSNSVRLVLSANPRCDRDEDGCRLATASAIQRETSRFDMRVEKHELCMAAFYSVRAGPDRYIYRLCITVTLSSMG